jgi:putative nucleotidyltransferase with HDIG domain
MIPTRAVCRALFDKYQLPSQKRIHVEEVTKLALFLGGKLIEKGITVNLPLLEAAGLLHDIDKNIPPKMGERHPETAVRILTELGFTEVAQVVARHSLHHILNPVTAPQTWEEKILYLADKMTKYEVVGVAARFKLWYRENLPQAAVAELDASYPLVRQLEHELFQAAGIDWQTIQTQSSL